MSDQEKKIEKLRELLTMIDESLTKEDFLKAFEMVVVYVKDISKKLKNESRIEIEKIRSDAVGMMRELHDMGDVNFRSIQRELQSILLKNIENIDNQIKKSLNESLEKSKNDAYNKFNKLNNEIDVLKDSLVFIKDKIEEKKPQELPKELTPEELRDKLESLDGKERIDIDAINGIEDLKKDIKDATNRKPFIFGGRGVQLYIDDTKKGLAQTINIKAGANTSIAHSESFGRNDITITGTDGGDVDGPASSVDGNVVFFDGVTGKKIKDSGLTLSGSNTGDQDLSGLVPYTGATADVNLGANRLTFSTGGSASAPKVAIKDDNTGIYQSTGGRLQFAIGGSEVIRLDTADAVSVIYNIPVKLGLAGSATAPSYTWISNVGSGTGIYRPATSTIGISTNGVERLNIGATGTIALSGILNITHTADAKTLTITNLSANTQPIFEVVAPTTGGQKAFHCRRDGDSYAFAEFGYTTGGAGKPGFIFGSGAASRDTNIYRDDANVLKTDDSFTVAGTLKVGTLTGVLRADSGTVSADTDVIKRIIQLKIIDDATTLTTGDGKLIFCIPSDLNGWDLIDADAFVTTVSSSGTPTIQIRNVTDSQDMLSTRITIDASEYTSYTAATAPVINTSYDDVATGDRIAIDVDVAGTGAKGLGVILVFRKP